MTETLESENDALKAQVAALRQFAEDVNKDCYECPKCGAFKPVRAGLGHDDGCALVALLADTAGATEAHDPEVREQAAESFHALISQQAAIIGALRDKLLEVRRGHASHPHPNMSRCWVCRMDFDVVDFETPKIVEAHDAEVRRQERERWKVHLTDWSRRFAHVSDPATALEVARQFDRAIAALESE